MPIPIILDGSSTQVGTTLPTIRQELAATLGYAATGTVTSEADSLEAEQFLISRSLQSDQAPPSALDGLYAYILAGDEARSQRAVMNGELEGAYGAFRVDRPYEAGPLATGTPFELATMPAQDYQGVTGLNTIINLALRGLPLIDFVQVTVTASGSQTVTQISLAGYPWPIKSVEAVMYPRTSTTTEARREMPKTWTFDQDAELPMLSFNGGLPARVGDVIEVKLTRPANTRIKRNGVWSDSRVGLALETDETLYDAATVVAAARPIALQRLALRHERGSKTRAQIEDEADRDLTAATMARFHKSFRGDGIMRVRPVGRR